MRRTYLQGRLKEEDGQAILMVALAMAFFLIAAVGLGIDGSHLYSQRQMAQTAADSAAQAAIMSIFDGTNTTGTAAFTSTVGTNFNCAVGDAKTPCAYATKNGFAKTGDTINVAFGNTGPAGVALSSVFPTNVVTVTVTRPVTTFLVRLAGPTSSSVQARAVAAIVSVTSPVPILVLHPTLAGSFGLNGGVTVTICGGPHRSIQVNSNNSNASQVSGNSNSINLSKAGPPDTGNCTTGNGADFGSWGGPALASIPFNFNGGTSGHYLQPASWMQDPLANVSAPSKTGFPSQTTGAQPTYAAGAGPCPASAGSHGCTLLSPGNYASGISLRNTTAIFKPGIYYTTGGFACLANCNAVMASGYTDSATPTGTGTTWDGTAANGGMMVYNTGSGQFSVGSNGSANLVGSSPSSAYKGILFFEDRTAAANIGSKAHSLGGGGDLTLLGTIYLTNTRATILGTSSHYQELDLQGNPGNNTLVQGEIIVDSLQLGGNAGIKMNLNSTSAFTVSQVALVQ